MAVAYVAKKGVAEAVRASVTAFPLPSGAAATQGMLISCIAFGSEAATVFGTPDGCEKKLDRYDSAFEARRAIFWGIYDGSTVPEVKHTGSLETSGALLTFSGVDINSWDTASAIGMITTAVKEPALPVITTATANEMIVAWQWEDSAVSSTAVPAGTTLRLQNGEESTFALHIATGIQASAGSTGALHFTFGSAVGGVVAMVALKAAASGEAPSATSEAASSVAKTTGTLNGTVNPHSQATTYWWEYGTTEAFGSKTTEESAGEGSGGVAKSKGITGLTPGTRYFFRFVAKNATGTTEGSTLGFTTEAEGSPTAHLLGALGAGG